VVRKVIRGTEGASSTKLLMMVVRLDMYIMLACLESNIRNFEKDSRVFKNILAACRGI